MLMLHRDCSVVVIHHSIVKEVRWLALQKVIRLERMNYFLLSVVVYKTSLVYSSESKDLQSC